MLFADLTTGKDDEQHKMSSLDPETRTNQGPVAWTSQLRTQPSKLGFPSPVRPQLSSWDSLSYVRWNIRNCRWKVGKQLLPVHVVHAVIRSVSWEQKGSRMRTTATSSILCVGCPVDALHVDGRRASSSDLLATRQLTPDCTLLGELIDRKCCDASLAVEFFSRNMREACQVVSGWNVGQQSTPKRYLLIASYSVIIPCQHTEARQRFWKPR